MRSSNIELLRIVCMFMVLALHANFMALGTPAVGGGFLPNCFRLLSNFSTIFAVNVFILISGWFGIKGSVKGFCKFVFQVAFFLIGSYLAGLLIFGNPLELKTLVNTIFIKQWFVQAYMLLYLLSPVLNRFADNSDKREQQVVIVAFFLFELVYDVCFETINVCIGHGYSAISFMGLYLLARYVHRFGLPAIFVERPGTWLLLIIVIETALSFVGLSFGTSSPMWKMCYYDNPLNVIAAMFMLMLFERLHFSSRTVNYIATSSFAVFLFHANNTFLDLYTLYARTIFEHYSGYLYLIIIVLYMSAWFAVSVVFDQIRILLWDFLFKLSSLCNTSVNFYRKINS